MRLVPTNCLTQDHDAPVADKPVLVAEAATEESAETKNSVPVNPDDIDRTDNLVTDSTVRAQSSEAAAWMSLVQSIYASAEFRFVR